ncbi:DeoR/GlpR family DNA-binding transcription regulator [Mumia sp. Pv 4-285]|uniref:DeoR/GlpR family DNA-binding transcription regulator n=1 Tax=Mumia qirimensis TaxID=3234852 RepID=UPI00351D6F45
MRANLRHERLLDLLETSGPVDVATLARVLDVSDATIRRDLSALERTGQLRRLHGGAAPALEREAPFERVATQNPLEKRAIAEHAATLVPDGAVVLLDIGTTTSLVARLLRGRSVTVITSSLAVYDELRDDPVVDLMLLGGLVRTNYHSMVGFLTEQAIAQVQADILFLGTSGVRQDGSVYDTTAVEVPVKKAMLQVADRVVLLADHTKLPGGGYARVCGPDQYDVLVTDREVDEESARVLGGAGVELHVAGPLAAGGTTSDAPVAVQEVP